MECPKCESQIDSENSSFCARCGWDLTKPFPPPMAYAPVPTKTCPECNSPALSKTINPRFCPSCGAYLGFNRMVLNKKLVEIARGWNGKRVDFFIQILGLSKRYARALANSITVIDALAIGESEALGVRNLGPKGYEALDTARMMWKPKK